MRKAWLAGISLLAAVCSTPSSAVVVFLDGVSTVSSGYQFNYSGNFSGGEGVAKGSELVIFDFQGYVPNSISAGGAADVKTSIENYSNLPSYGYTDDPNIPNLVFTYTGATEDLSNVAFSGLSAISTLGATALDGFSALTVKTSGAIGTIVASQGAVGVPAAVPEPAAWALMLAGFAITGTAMRRRPRRNLVTA